MARAAPKAPQGTGFTSQGGRITVRSRGHIELDLQALAASIGPAAVGHVLTRVDEGKDLKDQPFEKYTRPYADWLTEVGENPMHVDLRLTGGLMNSVAVRDVAAKGDGFTMVIGPGTGTSEMRTGGGTHGEDGDLRTTNRRGPPHNLVGKYLSRKRPWLGLSPRGKKLVTRIIERAKAFKGGV